MEQPLEFVDSLLPSHVCKLRKAIYGLKQVPRAWYLELVKFLLTFGFKKFVVDSSLFVYYVSRVVLYFLVYVDDIILTGNSIAFVNSFVNCLAERFSLKDLGPLHHFLGVEVVPTPDGLFL